MNKNKRIAIIILSSVFLLCTVITLLSVDSIVDSILDLYRSLISTMPESDYLATLLDYDILKKCFFADIAILFITGLVTLYYSIMDRILEKRTLLIVCAVAALLSCIDVVSLLVALAEFIILLTITDDKGKQPSSKRKKPTIKKLED